MVIYRTSARRAEFTLTEKKSEFIGVCAPVANEAEALEFIAEIKKKHSAARHNVYAYMLREGFSSRYSDDGEPHGTAGVPVLDAIKKAGITDTAVVVTRYFGGILLGTGGLLRAYTAAAAGAVNAAGVAEVGSFAMMEIRAGYSDYQKLLPLISALGAAIESQDFSESVRLVVSVAQEAAQSFSQSCRELTGGRADAIPVGIKCDFVAKP